MHSAKRGVPCEASEVSTMIRDAASVYAVCMSESKVLGVGAVTARQVEVRKSEEDDSATAKIASAFAGAVVSPVTGSLVGFSSCNVEVSGLALGLCVVMQHKGVGEALNVWKWGAAKGVGRIASYNIKDNKLLQLSITMEAGGFWIIDGIHGWKGVGREEVHRWMEAQVVARDEEDR